MRELLKTPNWQNNLTSIDYRKAFYNISSTWVLVAEHTDKVVLMYLHQWCCIKLNKIKTVPCPREDQSLKTPPYILYSLPKQIYWIKPHRDVHVMVLRKNRRPSFLYGLLKQFNSQKLLMLLMNSSRVIILVGIRQDCKIKLSKYLPFILSLLWLSPFISYPLLLLHHHVGSQKHAVGFLLSPISLSSMLCFCWRA